VQPMYMDCPECLESVIFHANDYSFTLGTHSNEDGTALCSGAWLSLSRKGLPSKHVARAISIKGDVVKCPVCNQRTTMIVLTSPDETNHYTGKGYIEIHEGIALNRKVFGNPLPRCMGSFLVVDILGAAKSRACAYNTYHEPNASGGKQKKPIVESEVTGIRVELPPGRVTLRLTQPPWQHAGTRRYDRQPDFRPGGP
jgi:hypothetical protein